MCVCFKEWDGEIGELCIFKKKMYHAVVCVSSVLWEGCFCQEYSYAICIGHWVCNSLTVYQQEDNVNNHLKGFGIFVATWNTNALK